MYRKTVMMEEEFEEAGGKALPGVMVVNQKGEIIFLNQTAAEFLKRIGSAQSAADKREALDSVVRDLLAEWPNEEPRSEGTIPNGDTSVHRMSIGSETVVLRLLELRPRTDRPESSHRLLFIEKSPGPL